MKRSLCSCVDCARLDLAFPGEGVQLALTLPAKTKPRRRRPPALASSAPALEGSPR